MWVAGAQTLESSSVASVRPLVGSWIRRGAAGHEPATTQADEPQHWPQSVLDRNS